MGWLLGMCGFGGRSVARDRITVVAGASGYSTTSLPPDSPSSTSFGGSGSTFRRPFYQGDSILEASSGVYGFHGRILTGVNAANTLMRCGVGRNGAEVITVSAADTTNKITLRVNGTVVATATTQAFALATWARVHVKVHGSTPGSLVEVFWNGNLATPVISYTLNANASHPNEFFFASKIGATELFDDFFAWDPGDSNFPGDAFLIEMGIKEQVFTGNGPEQDWSGSYTDIDDRPASDADKITASAVGAVSTFSKDAIAQDNVYAVQVNARVTRTGTDAGANMSIRATDGTSTTDVTAAAPGDGDVTAVFDLAPDGLPWSSVKYDANRFGFVAVA